MPQSGDTAFIIAIVKGNAASVQALLADVRVQVHLQNKVRNFLVGFLSMRIYRNTSWSCHHDVSRHSAAMILMSSICIQYGFTALMKACYYGHTAVVQVLLANASVEVNLKNKVSARCSIALRMC